MEEQAPSQPQQTNQYPSSPNPPKSKKIILLAAVLIVIVVIIASYISSQKPTSQKMAAVTNTKSSSAAKQTSTNSEQSAGQLSETYSNKTNGLNFSYPSGWKVTTDKASPAEPVYNVALTSSGDKKLDIGIWKTTEVSPTTIEEHLSSLNQKAKQEKLNLIITPVTIDGNEAVRYDFGRASDTTAREGAAFVSKGNFYLVNYYGGSPSEFAEILPTIKIAK